MTTGQAATGPVARLASVSHRYGKVTALDDLTLAIPAGRMVGQVGPDGVGESTLMRLISGAKRLQAGEIDTLGGDISSARHRGVIGRQIAFMPQGSGKNLYHDLSIRENLEFFGKLFGQGRADLTADRRNRPCAVSGPPGG